MAGSNPHSSPKSMQERVWTGLLYVSSALVLAFLTAPVLAIVPLSFNSGQFLTYPLQGLSLRWYEEFFTDPAWTRSLWNSLYIGAVSTLLATILGTMAALGLTRADFPGKTAVAAILLSPIVVPLVITAVGVYFFFAQFNLNATYTGLILVQTALGAPFVVITVSATLRGYDTTLSRAAASLGAGPLTTFFRVTLPLIGPGVASGALFAFATSFDEVVVVLLVGGPEQRTLPREMFSGIRENISPTIIAAATILIVVAAALLAVLELLRRRNERLRGQA
ncbi:ABC transporter permease [Arenibaculum sp.]|jgi:putative spermidine/putrescine transport system permease protein|uniref:ABC transporter permease n=1 Tax=Arenibaculum sp. TaxID=2865862 RepID=UPI002E108812|nr:ABC transporter permease [Arenibaculum sp.]